MCWFCSVILVGSQPMLSMICLIKYCIRMNRRMTAVSWSTSFPWEKDCHVEHRFCLSFCFCSVCFYIENVFRKYMFQQNTALIAVEIIWFRTADLTQDHKRQPVGLTSDSVYIQDDQPPSFSRAILVSALKVPCPTIALSGHCIIMTKPVFLRRS